MKRHPIATGAEHRPSDWAYSSWRFAVRKHRAEQRRVAHILSDHWERDIAKQGKRMGRCCTAIMAAVHLKSAAVKVCPMHCDLALCAVCLQHRHRSTLKKAHYCIGETMQDGEILRHIVFTTPKWSGDIREAAERAAWWFSRLKRRKAWKLHIRASMAVFEVTGNATDGWGWHVHCLTLGKWWLNQCKVTDVRDLRAASPVEFIGPLVRLEDYGETYTRPARPGHECECIHQRGPYGDRNAPDERCLMQEWFQVTGGDAYIAHISAAGTHHRSGESSAIAEAIKYVVKTQNLDAISLIDFAKGMRAFQRVRWSGLWYGMQPPDAEKNEPRVMVDPDDLWRFSTGDLDELAARLTSGEPLVIDAAKAAGWTLHPFIGPVKAGRPRPPPSVVLPQPFAVLAVEGLEQASTDLDNKTERYLAEHPDRRMAFTIGAVPY